MGVSVLLSGSGVVRGGTGVWNGQSGKWPPSELIKEPSAHLTSSLPLFLLLKELGLTHVWPLQHVVRVRRREKKQKKVGEG